MYATNTETTFLRGRTWLRQRRRKYPDQYGRQHPSVSSKPVQALLQAQLKPRHWFQSAGRRRICCKPRLAHVSGPVWKQRRQRGREGYGLRGMLNGLHLLLTNAETIHTREKHKGAQNTERGSAPRGINSGEHLLLPTPRASNNTRKYTDCCMAPYLKGWARVTLDEADPAAVHG